MKEKTQYEALMEELKKLANTFRDAVTELGDVLAKILPDVEIPEEEEEPWKMKIPFKYNDGYYLLSNNGNVEKCWFNTEIVDKPRFYQGHIFKTRQAAELEGKRRNLLTEIRAFRDECNGDWDTDWNNEFEYKFYISFHENTLRAICSDLYNDFPLFGYFKNEEDCKKAIELFGDEIKSLFT